MSPALGDFLLDSRPGFACGKTDDSGIFQFRMHNVSKASGISLETRRRIPRDAHRKIDQFAVTPGDILFNATNSPENTGKSILIPELDEPAVYSNHFVRLRTNPQELCPEYLWRFLQWHYQSGTFRGMIRAWVNQASVSRADLLALPLDPPTLHNQRRIASILDEADAIRRKRRAQLVELEKLRPTLFHRMFGERSPDCELGDLIIEGPTNGLYKPASSYGEGTPILRIDSFSNGYMRDNPWRRVQTTTDEFAKYSIREGDIVINRVNALSHLGKAILIEDLEEPSVFESNMMRLRLDSAHILSEYVISWLLTSDARQQIAARAKKAINQASINQSDVRGLLLPKPSIDEQRVFANSVNAIRAERDRVAKALEADEELFAALQHTAFRGEL